MLEHLIRGSTPFSAHDIEEIEGVIGRRLPESYVDFVRRHGGAYIGGVVIIDSEEYPILDFYGPGAADGVIFQMRLREDFEERGIVPFAHSDFGNIFIFDADNAIHYIDYYGLSWGRAVQIKNLNISFSELLEAIREEDDDDN